MTPTAADRAFIVPDANESAASRAASRAWHFEQEMREFEQRDVSPTEATAQLKKFRPIKRRPADLEHILSCRADPNFKLDKHDITPLQNVMTFATETDIAAMRELLLKHGARESEEEAKRWVTSQKSALCERVRLSEYYEDQRDFNPWDATMERALM